MCNCEVNHQLTNLQALHKGTSTPHKLMLFTLTSVVGKKGIGSFEIKFINLTNLDSGYGRAQEVKGGKRLARREGPGDTELVCHFS